jgi:xylulokinase
LLAGVGAHAWGDVPSACARSIHITGSTSPDPTQVEAYRKAYPIYRALYPALKPEFDRM